MSKLDSDILCWLQELSFKKWKRGILEVQIHPGQFLLPHQYTSLQFWSCSSFHQPPALSAPTPLPKTSVDYDVAQAHILHW